MSIVKVLRFLFGFCVIFLAGLFHEDLFSYFNPVAGFGGAVLATMIDFRKHPKNERDF